MWRVKCTFVRQSDRIAICSLFVFCVFFFNSSNQIHTNTKAVRQLSEDLLQLSLFCVFKSTLQTKAGFYLFFYSCQKRSVGAALRCLCQEKLIRMSFSFPLQAAHICTRTWTFELHQARTCYSTQQEPLLCLQLILFVLMELRIPRAHSQYCEQPQSINDLRLAF